MAPNTVPGVNRWRAVKEGGGGRRRQPPDGVEIGLKRAEGPDRCPSRQLLNTDPRLLPERTGVYVEDKRGGCAAARPSSAGGGSYSLGAAVSKGYGRAPTTFLYTSADTLLPTTHYQSPTKPAAATAGTGDEPHRRLQAYAFTPAAFMATRGSGVTASHSAPASPLDRRTLLYSRAADQSNGTNSPGAAQQLLYDRQLQPAADLLDRMTLLRRLAPTTCPAARPPQLTAGAGAALVARTSAPHHFTPAPASPVVKAQLQQQQAQSCQPSTAGPSGVRRWAWDDSLLDGGTSARPIGVTPAPGWSYCGDIVPAATAEAQGMETAAHAAAGCQDGTAHCLTVAVGGAPGGAGSKNVVMVVHSPRHHQLEEEGSGEGEGQEALNGSGNSRTAAGGRRVAFRPPGPLQHKFGNKPRPTSAPSSADSAADQARAAGLRDCGCPRSHRTSGTGCAGLPRRQAPAAGGQVSMVGPSRPRSAGTQLAAARQQHASSSVETEAAIAAVAFAGPSRSTDNCDTSGCGNIATVEVTAGQGTNVVVISSPWSSAAAGPRDGSKDDVVTVAVAASPRRHGALAGRGSASMGGLGAGDLIVVHQEVHQRPTPPGAPPQPGRLRSPPAAAAGAGVADATPARAAHTKLTVTMPAGGGRGSYSIHADATSAGVAAAAFGAGAASSRRCGSPIKAWRPPEVQAVAQPAARPAEVPRRPASRPNQPAPAGFTTEVTVEVSSTPPRHHTQPQGGGGSGPGSSAAAGELQLLSSEIWRREQSFQQLLQELERITDKCSRLTAGSSAAAGCGVAGGPDRSGTSQAAVGGAGAAGRAGQGRPWKPAAGGAGRGEGHGHSTHRFGGSTSADRAARRGASISSGREVHVTCATASVDDAIPAAGGARGSAGISTGRQEQGQGGSEWSWESLLAFETTIRERQRKLMEQGVLPPEYA